MIGVYTAIITPFNEDNTIDFASLEKLIQRQVDAGVAGLVVGGTTGEAATLSLTEKKELFSFVKKQAPDLEMIVGTGTNNTAESVKQTEMAREIGIEKVLIVTPYYNKPTCNGLYRHYSSIAETGAKIVLYNVPGRTSLNVTPKCLKKLSEIENIVAVKEASGNLAQLSDYFNLVSKNRFDFLTGDDFTIVPFISMGGKGVISVFSNVIPETAVKMVTLALDGSFKEAAEMQVYLNRFNHAMFLETNPLPAKTALHLMGHCKNVFRAPLDVMEQPNVENLTQILKEYSVL